LCSRTVRLYRRLSGLRDPLIYLLGMKGCGAQQREDSPRRWGRKAGQTVEIPKPPAKGPVPLDDDVPIAPAMAAPALSTPPWRVPLGLMPDKDAECAHGDGSLKKFEGEPILIDRSSSASGVVLPRTSPGFASSEPPLLPACDCDWATLLPPAFALLPALLPREPDMVKRRTPALGRLERLQSRRVCCSKGGGLFLCAAPPSLSFWWWQHEVRVERKLPTDFVDFAARGGRRERCCVDDVV